jgi:hypothetical protein
VIPGAPEELYRIARKAARIVMSTGMPGQEYEDLTQEGVTWLLESPGRAWVRAVDGTLEDPEDQLVADIAAHLNRQRSGFRV